VAATVVAVASAAAAISVAASEAGISAAAVRWAALPAVADSKEGSSVVGGLPPVDKSAGALVEAAVSTITATPTTAPPIHLTTGGTLGTVRGDRRHYRRSITASWKRTSRSGAMS
jgi:hypothetical protein